MSPLIVVGHDVFGGIRKPLEEQFDVVTLPPGGYDDVLAMLDDRQRRRATVLVVRGSSIVTQQAMSLLPGLRLVACVGSGYEGVDLAAAEARGIDVTRSPGVNAGSVADLAIGLMIALVRRIVEAHTALRARTWPGMSAGRSRALAGMRLGVLGLGAIGRGVARRGEMLEMLVGYHGRSVASDVTYPYLPSAIELAHWADVLVVAGSSTPETRHIVDGAVLERLGPRGYLVNVARSALVDEAALLRALRTGGIAGAALDVFDSDHFVPSDFVSLPNVITTPHIGADTDQSEQRMGAMVLANIDALFNGRPLLNRVAP